MMKRRILADTRARRHQNTPLAAKFHIGRTKKSNAPRPYVMRSMESYSVIFGNDQLPAGATRSERESAVMAAAHPQAPILCSTRSRASGNRSVLPGSAIATPIFFVVGKLAAIHDQWKARYTVASWRRGRVCATRPR